MVPVTYRPLLLFDFCTAEITWQKKGIFLIPLTTRFLFTVGTKLLEGISDPIKTDVTICHRPKKEIKGPNLNYLI